MQLAASNNYNERFNDDFLVLYGLTMTVPKRFPKMVGDFCGNM